MASDFNLARLIQPFDVSRFLDEYWEAKTLVVTRDQPRYFDSLLTMTDIDRVLTTMNLHHPDVQMTNAAKEIKGDDYLFTSGMADTSRMFQQYAEGGTIILPNLEYKLPALAALCRSMESELSTRFQTNIYLTPGNAQGFKTHYDTHDVFVLQVHGSKHWRIYDNPVQLPYRGQQFRAADTKPGAMTMEFDLHPGDMVYVPRGVMHDANTHDAGGSSLHITLGVLFTSWTDLLLEAMAMAGLSDPIFRKALPVGFARQDFDRTAARKLFKDLWLRLADKAEFDPALDHFVQDMISTRHPLLPGQLSQMERLPALTIDTRVGARPSLLAHIHETPEHVTVSAYGGTTTLPRHVAEPLRFALSNADYKVGQLPGSLDDAGKLVLVRRLIREGLVHQL